MRAVLFFGSLFLFLFASIFPPLVTSVPARQSDLRTEAKRIEVAVRKIFDIGIKPSLTREELEFFNKLRFEFPLPERGDYFLNFYAGVAEGKPVVVMPALSLKTFEDLATAFAWLNTKRYRS